MTWDPEVYLNYSRERERAARDLIQRVAVAAPRYIADLGCGAGNVTALLQARWPEAAIEGVDSSPEMIAKAKTSNVKAAWRLQDISDWSPPLLPDVVFSNAALHWLSDHHTLFPRLLKCLASGGVLAVQMPDNFDEPSHIIPQKAFADVTGADFPRALTRPVLTIDTYYEILRGKVVELDIWRAEYLQVLKGADAVYDWLRATALRVYDNEMTSKNLESFHGECRTRLAKAYPMNNLGEVLFPFTRLFLVARK